MFSINSSPVDFLLALYPEIHYRFRLFKFSRYFRREPEIVVDIPRRVESETVPVTVLVKDAHLFPFSFTAPLEMEFIGDNGTIIQKFELPAGKIDRQWWWEIHQAKLPPGKYRVWAHIAYRAGRKERKILNHNFPGLPPTPLRLLRADEPLPKPADYLLGDLHCHSSFTSDQVEYGAPLKPLARTAKAMGLDFIAVTDHTYDMDDLPENYLMNDPELAKWRAFKTEAADINANSSPEYAYIIPGQEITVRNSRSKNVHLLLFGAETLFTGAGDSAEKWLQTGSEHSIEQILSLKAETAVAGAAHPHSNINLAQKLLLRRGQWKPGDFLPGITGAQIANGKTFFTIDKGINYWVDLLKRGKKAALWAGNDAHGNFNHFRQIKYPMWALHESDLHILGTHRTGLFAPGGETGIMDALAKGHTYITNGPAIDLRVKTARPGDTIELGQSKLEIDFISSPEYGELSEICLFIHNESEIEGEIFDITQPYKTTIGITLDLRPGFIFAKAKTKQEQFCFTSAIYIR